MRQAQIPRPAILARAAVGALSMVHVAGLYLTECIKLIPPELGEKKNATNEKARRLLGWSPRSNEESLVATAESLVRLGLLKDSPKKAA